MIAALRITIPANTLWENDDPAYLVWVRAVVAETTELLKEAHSQT